MQTFVPHPSFRESARALDTRRLGKQRVEALQILRALTREQYGWKHHPATLMWKGYEEALASYARAIIDEWCARGHADTCQATITADLEAAGITDVRSEEELQAAGDLPPWWGDDDVHRSHRSALLRKDPDFYRDRFPDEPDDLEYVWPVRNSA